MLSRTLIVLLALSGSSHLTAQIITTPEATSPTGVGVRRWDRLEGSRLRISTLGPASAEGAGIEGTLTAARGDTLFLRVVGQDHPVAVMAGGNTMVEEWRHRNPTTGFVVAGLLVGSVAGGVIANLMNDKPEPRQCRGDFDQTWAALGCALGAGIATSVEQSTDQVGALLLGVVAGAALGALGGRQLAKSLITEGWSQVTLRGLDVRPMLGGGVHVGLELTF